MYICLATDALDSVTRASTLEPQQLNSPEDTLLLSSSLREHILCAVKLYQDGVLEISPAFSSIVEEDSTTTLLQSSIGQAGSPMSVFLDDSTIEAGMRKGFRLSSFKVRSIKGAEYEYVLHNVNDILVPHQLEAIATKQSVQNAIKAAENRSSTIGGHNWKQDPSKKDRTLGVYAEIVSGKSFEGDSLVVTYELVLPQNWTLRTGDLSDGVANSDGDTASVSSASSASIHSGSRAGDYGMMRGATHAAIVSQPIRTFFQIPLHRPKWRGIQLAYSLESCSLGEPSRIIIGLSFFVVSVFSVIIGLEYPLWVVPALGILLVTGMGVPGGPPQVVLIRNNTTTTTTNTAIMKVDHQQNSSDRTPQVDTHSPTAVFNHLIRFSVDVSDIDPEGAGGYACKAPSAHMATLVFQVYSSSWFGRYRLEGCGYHHLSDRPGQEAVEIKTWKPVGGGIRDKMNDLFLGNSVQFKDNLFVDSVNKASVALNKFGVQSQSSGSIFLRTQSISTDARRVDEFFREHSEQVVMHAEASNKVKKTVDDILRSFRSSTTGLPMRASSSREALGIAALTPSKQAMRSSRDSPSKPSSVSSILASLNNASRDKDNRVAEILARARAKVQRGAGSSVSSSSSRATSSSSTAPPPLQQQQQQQQVDSSSSSSSSGSKSKSLRTMFGSGMGGANIDSPCKDMNTPYDPFIPIRTGTEQQQQSTTLASSSSSSSSSSLSAMDSTLVDRSIRLDRKAIPPIRGLRQPHRYDSPSSSDNNNNNNERPLQSPSTARQSDANDANDDDDEDDDKGGEEAPLLLQP